MQEAAGAESVVTVVVTAEVGDEEMVNRIARHRHDRPSHWLTVEAPYELAAAVEAVAGDQPLLLDCLTFWIANRVMSEAPDAEIEAEAERLVALLAQRSSPTVVVSNEVGHGIVPGDALSRRFRDVHGRVNRIVADRAGRAHLVVAGRVIELDRP